jgi:4-diphosphocytidyl-2-C-methyl-D-erythritol kinase
MTPAPVRSAAPAKINLYLHVTGVRAEGEEKAGFHTLDSLVVFASVQDVVSAEPGDGLSLSADGPFADKVPLDDGNLVLRAARALRDLAGTDRGAALHLTKRLPAAAGIGGGSADAAAALRALCRLWEIAPDPAALSRLALDLGADVPVCLAGKAAFMAGVGELLAPAPRLPEAWFVLVNPGVAVATPDVFRARAGGFSGDGRFAYAPRDARELAALMGARRNDLEEAARSVAPVIGDVLAALAAQPGCLLARLSGSGATAFGLFATAEASSQAALALAGAHPDWWVRPAALETDTRRLDAAL